jgi:hypothetical protein
MPVTQRNLGTFNFSENRKLESLMTIVGILWSSYCSAIQNIFPAKKKPVNLPSFSKLTLDMYEIMSGHTPNGNRNPEGKKDVFYGMTAYAIQKAIREAYEAGSRLATQGERIFVMGYSNTYRIFVQMWVNVKTLVIESAWPK